MSSGLPRTIPASCKGGELNSGLPDCNSSALTTQPRCLLNTMMKFWYQLISIYISVIIIILMALSFKYGILQLTQWRPLPRIIQRNHHLKNTQHMCERGSRLIQRVVNSAHSCRTSLLLGRWLGINMHRQSTFSNYVSSMFKQSSAYHTVMHQSIPAAPICPPWQSRGWGICKFCSTRGPGICQPRGYSQAFDMHAVSYQNITTQRILLENKHIGLIVKDRYRKKLKRVEQTCSRFYACIFSLLIKT